MSYRSSTTSTDHHTVVIGGGPAGLAMSRSLQDREIDHVVLERGQIAQRWRTERWDSLKLLTPNWMTRLPGHTYAGADPEGFMTAPEVTAMLADYATGNQLPVREATAVERVAALDRGFAVDTDAGRITGDNVVIATGAAQIPSIPATAAGLPAAVDQIASNRYRNPEQLASGGVLVVGASASGLQIADELARSGRDVVLAAGRHTRLPRTYRGMDIHWWLDRIGSLDRTHVEAHDLTAARREPSLQLVGSAERRDLDLSVAVADGVRLAGRLMRTSGSTVEFSSDLASACQTADEALDRVLARIDDHATATGLDAEVEPAMRPRPVVPEQTPRQLNLSTEGISTVVWATGFRREYPWLEVPVLTRRGELDHYGGITPWPGLYAMGLPFMRRRKSTFIDGFGADANDLADHIVNRHLSPRSAAPRGLVRQP